MYDLRDKVVDSYYRYMHSVLNGDSRSILKLQNHPTGSGKTRAFFTAFQRLLQNNLEKHIIGIYAAPLRDQLKNQQDDAPIPVFVARSLEMLTRDPVRSELYAIAGKLQQKSACQVDAIALRIAIERLQETELLDLKMFHTPDERKNQIKACQHTMSSAAHNLAESILNNGFTLTTARHNEYRCIALIVPMYILASRSGILLLTHAKLNTRTGIPYVAERNGQFKIRNKPLYDLPNIDQYIEASWMWAIDEIEEWYRSALKNCTTVSAASSLSITSVFSSIHRELRTITDTLPAGHTLQQLLAVDSDTLTDAWRTPEIDRDSWQQWYADQLMQGSSDSILERSLLILHTLHSRVREIEKFLQSQHIANQEIIPTLESVIGVLGSFANARTMIIPYDVYQNYADGLLHIFSHHDHYIYDYSRLYDLHLKQLSNGFMRIDDTHTRESISLLELLYTVLAVRALVIPLITMYEGLCSQQDFQSAVLAPWRRRINRTASRAKDVMQDPVQEYLDAIFVYRKTKTSLNIHDLQRYQDTINERKPLIGPEFREVSIGVVSIQASPEQKLIDLASQGKQAVFLLSATGGIEQEITNSPSFPYLKQQLSLCDATECLPMQPEEIKICEEIRIERATHRRIAVNFFSDLPAPEMLMKRFIHFIESDGYLNIYKKMELERFWHFLTTLAEDKQLQSMLVLTQSTKFIQKFIDHYLEMHEVQLKIAQRSDHEHIYTIQYKSYVSIRLIVYSADFDSRYRSAGADGQDSSEDSDLQILKEQQYLAAELYEHPQEKLLMLTTYRSAGFALNLTLQKGTKEKDFDSLVMLMDPYYSDIRPRVQNMDPGEQVRRSFAVMKHVAQTQSASRIADFAATLHSSDSRRFIQNQHIQLIGKIVIQAVGRIERRNYPDQASQLYVNEETRENLVEFYRTAERSQSRILQGMSPLNHALYTCSMEEARASAIQDYQRHVQQELQSERVFRLNRRHHIEQLIAYRSGETATISFWNLLRDPRMCSAPEEYLLALQESGLFTKSFIDTLYYIPTQPPFIPWLEDVQNEDTHSTILSDMLHGDRAWHYIERLVPESVYRQRHNDNTDWHIYPRSRRFADIMIALLPKSTVLRRHIPRPPFFYDILLPTFSEELTRRWIAQELAGTDLHYEGGFNHTHPQLTELFDLYYSRRNSLYCIDVKAWTRYSDASLSTDTVDEARHKLQTIRTVLPEYQTVSGLLLNLVGETQNLHGYGDKLYSANMYMLDPQGHPVPGKNLNTFFEM